MIDTNVRFDRFDEPFTHYTTGPVIPSQDLKRLNAELPAEDLYRRQVKEGREFDKNYQMWLFDLAEDSLRLPATERLPQAWSELVDSLLSKEFTEWASDGLGIDLAACPLTLGLYRYGDRDYTTVSTAKLTKAMHWALYLNEDWAPEFGGRLNLWSARDAAEPAVEITPAGGTCAMFAPTEHTWHNIGKVTTGGQVERLTIMLEYWKPE
ncbi:2OG-Fe(II) oxygenase [Lentzea sp. NPDC004782]|uniref:2OG-Fe(II) oxygenase n=1 Tax=Lentzea sp. NPDC004782 TaxID=3154458 RepID=UPI0033B9DDE3